MNQMTKTLVMLGVLAAIAGGIGLYAWKGVYEKDEKAAQKKAFEERLFSTERQGGRDAGAADVDFHRIVVKAKGETTVLEHVKGEPWRITEPVSAKVDPLVIDGLVSQLQSARFKMALEGEATDAELKTYGLDAPSFSVEAEATVDGALRKTRLEGGIENPFDGSIYMRKDGSRTVQMAEGGVRWSLAKTTFDLRSKEIFGLDEPKVTRVALKSKSNDWELERGDDKLWHLLRPEATLADSVTVASMLGGIRGERALAFVNDTSDSQLKAMGFDEPLMTATFTLPTGVVKVRMTRSAFDGGEGVYYALREDAEGRIVARIEPSARAAFDRNAIELRDRSLIPFAKQLVTKIVIAAPGVPEVIVERDSADAGLESWRVTAPKSGPAKAYKVATMLWTLAAIKAGSLVVEKPDQKVLETYSLDVKHARTVKLFTGTTELATLVLGKELIGKAGSSYAMGARQAIVEIDSSRFNELPWSADDLLAVTNSDGGL